MKIKPYAWSVGLALSPLIIASEAQAAAFSRIYGFGDSLVDTGNTFELTASFLSPGVPQSPPYAVGRFSNGPLWIEYLAAGLGVPRTNFAFAAATTGESNEIVPLLSVPGLQTQIDGFLASTPAVDHNGGYVIWAGANDYLGGSATDPSGPVGNLVQSVNKLATAGAENIAVVNLPDLGSLPQTLGTPNAAALSLLTEAHNGLLAARLQTIPADNITLIDVAALFEQAIAGDLGFADVTDACLQDFTQPFDFDFTVCDNPDGHLFWDDIHPTRRTHSLIGDIALAALHPAAPNGPGESVPEPSMAIGLLALTGLGLKLTRR